MGFVRSITERNKILVFVAIGLFVLTAGVYLWQRGPQADKASWEKLTIASSNLSYNRDLWPIVKSENPFISPGQTDEFPVGSELVETVEKPSSGNPIIADADRVIQAKLGNSDQVKDSDIVYVSPSSTPSRAVFYARSKSGRLFSLTVFHGKSDVFADMSDPEATKYEE